MEIDDWSDKEVQLITDNWIWSFSLKDNRIRAAETVYADQIGKDLKLIKKENIKNQSTGSVGTYYEKMAKCVSLGIIMHW